MAKTATKKPAAKKTTKTAAKKKTTKKPAAKKTAAKKTVKKADAESLGDDVVQVDRREGDRRDENSPVAVKTERRKVARRRQIDPTTCERDYSDHEIEFMQAMDAYKRSSGRMFPTCSEILEVVRALGYSRPGDEPVADATAETATGATDAEDEVQSDETADLEATADSDLDLE